MSQLGGHGQKKDQAGDRGDKSQLPGKIPRWTLRGILRMNLRGLRSPQRPRTRSREVILFNGVSPASLLPRAAAHSRLFDQQVLSHEISSIEHGDGPSGLPLGRHLHKSESSGLAGLPVLDNVDRHHCSGLGEKSFELGAADFRRKVRHVHFLVYLTWSPLHVLPVVTLGLFSETIHAQ